MLVTRSSQKTGRRQVTHDSAGLHCPACGHSASLVGKDREAALRAIRAFHAQHEACLRPNLEKAAAVDRVFTGQRPVRMQTAFRSRRCH